MKDDEAQLSTEVGQAIERAVGVRLRSLIPELVDTIDARLSLKFASPSAATSSTLAPHSLDSDTKRPVTTSKLSRGERINALRYPTARKPRQPRQLHAGDADNGDDDSATSPITSSRTTGTITSTEEMPTGDDVNKEASVALLQSLRLHMTALEKIAKGGLMMAAHPPVSSPFSQHPIYLQ